MQAKKEILLESGTNELEVLELGIGAHKEQCLGINVAKVREITAPGKVSKLPRSHPHISGLILMRNEILPVINLPRVLGLEEELEWNEGSFVVTEFNELKVVFHVGWVSQIHRISWEQIEKPSDMLQSGGSIVGVIKLEDKMIMLLDFEKIVVDINPATGINVKRLDKVATRHERGTKRILIAEDSAILRKLLEETLSTAGYTQHHIFHDGKQAWDYLLDTYDQQKENTLEQVHLMITDIEMPQMDGLHLTKKIKEHEFLHRIPVVIFSSLISESLKHKGDAVGANAQITKPQIDTLVETLDTIIFG
ncbi:chemotaxis signal transduction protein CheV [Ammoniphilus sp. CFH 90114]|nr:chemotaxis signal transduction protein CheV [Ammoniphilus sp. CFH 90114]